MTRRDMIVLMAARQEGWRRRDPKALAAVHSETCTVDSPIFARMTGRAQIEASYQALFTSFPDWDHQPGTPIIDGDRLAQYYHATATHVGDFMGLAGSGRRFEIHGVMLCRVADGLVVEEQRLYDFTGLLLQLGVLKVRLGK